MSDEGFRDAQRGAAKPLLGIYGQSGTGKTYTGLLVARGYVGKSGRIGMIDTESGRGEAYADPREYPEFAGADQKANYQVKPLHDNFSPESYVQAIEAAEKAKFDALLVDSGSHEWEGPGGVLALAAANDAAGKKGVLVWQQPKIRHKKFMLKLMQTPIPLVILCLRAKYPMEQKGEKWVRSQELEPIQADDVLFEMFVHGWVGHDHNFHPKKISSRSLAPLFKSNEKITVETGRLLRAWSDGTDIGTGTPESTMLSAEDFTVLKDEGHEAAEGGAAPLDGWKIRVRTSFWKNMDKRQRDTITALIPELDAKAIEADKRFADEPAG